MRFRLFFENNDFQDVEDLIIKKAFKAYARGGDDALGRVVNKYYTDTFQKRFYEVVG